MYRRAGWLRVAAIQFVVLTGCAMATYAGGTWSDPSRGSYDFTGNFLSDLGMTHAFSGRANHVASVMFGIALASLGAAFVAFAWGWRGFAVADRARLAGHASALLGTASGLAFVGVAVTPFDLSFALHNGFVIGAFGLLALYVAAITIVMWKNDAPGVAANLAYLALIVGYGALVGFGPPFTTARGHTAQVIGQKVVAYASMIHIVYLATLTRRASSASSDRRTSRRS